MVGRINGLPLLMENTLYPRPDRGPVPVSPAPLRVGLIADNQPLLANLRLLLEGEPDFTVTGSYPSAEAALRTLPWPDTDLVLVDIDLPGLSAVDLIRTMHPQRPQLRILAYALSEAREVSFAALKAGALGCLLKGSAPRDLAESLRRLHQGGAAMSPKIARQVIGELQVPAPRPQNERLTQRELEILNGIASGRSSKEMALAFGLSPHTIHTHLKLVYEKLHAATSAEALRKTRALGGA
jgi:two-component system NarL family response regulator